MKNTTTTKENILEALKSGKEVLFPHLSGKKFAMISPLGSKTDILVAWKGRGGLMVQPASADDLMQALIIPAQPERLTLRKTMSAHGPVMRGKFHGCDIEADPSGLRFTVIDEESRAEFYKFQNGDWKSTGENVTGEWDGNAFGEIFGAMLGLQK